MLKVLYQLSSAAQRFMEKHFLMSTNDMASIVPVSTAILISHSSLWPAALQKLNSVYDQLLECYQSEQPGHFHSNFLGQSVIC